MGQVVKLKFKAQGPNGLGGASCGTFVFVYVNMNLLIIMFINIKFKIHIFYKPKN